MSKESLATSNSLPITPLNSATGKVKWNQAEKLVWVKEKYTDYQAHFLEKDVASSTCLVIWVNTNKQEVVDSSNVFFDPPSK